MPPTEYVNLSRQELTVWALKTEADSELTDKGALAVNSYLKKGRSPTDKRIVDTPEVHKDVDWGKVNIALSEKSFAAVKARALKFLNMQERLFIVKCFAGHDADTRLKVKVVTTRAYHAMFMANMLIEPTPEELMNFGEADYTIYNAGEYFSDPLVPGVGSTTCVALNFKSQESVIMGTQYAGEMKKGILTVMMFLATRRGDLCMHASANESKETGESTVFFGLSGTGKTTLSADPARYLIGDDEHVWTNTGIYNIEGGCYAKAIGLREDTEPEIFRAIKFGSVAENVVLNPSTNEIDYDDVRLTENTRVAYPLKYVKDAKLPAVGTHPKNIIFLTNDAYGVMPPVSLLTPGQAKFWFVTGYTAKVAGTEVGVTEPQPTFSACFGGPFLVYHPTVYGRLLEEKMEEHGAKCWLVNTGWSGGKYGSGKRMKLSITRAIITAINDGTLSKETFETVPGWGLSIPRGCPNLSDTKVLNPINTWPDKQDFIRTIDHLANLFAKNFNQYMDKATPDMIEAVPKPYHGKSHL